MKKFMAVLCSLIIFCLVLLFAACVPQEEHEHVYSDEWSKYPEYHCREPLCDDTDEPIDKAAHKFNADHVCEVCGYKQAGLGSLTVADVSAWSDVANGFKFVFGNAAEAEAVTYEYDKTKIAIDETNKTVKSVNGFVGSVKVTIRSEHHQTTSFTVNCKSLPAASSPAYSQYAKQLGSGGLVDNNGNDTGERYTVTENTTVFIGDSFFDRRWFWTDFYTDDFSGKDAFLAGISEATTNDWEIYLNDVFAAFDGFAPKNIVIHLGTNNLGTKQTAEATAEGLQHFLLKLNQKFPQTKIYCFAITPRYDDAVDNENVSQVNSQTKEWCKERDFVKYLDTAWRFTRDKIRTDGIHPQLTSYSIFVEELEAIRCEIAVKG